MRILITLICLAWGSLGHAQIQSPEERAKELFNNWTNMAATAADVFLVDSVYCFNSDFVTGEQTPTIRQYNLAFNELGQVEEQIEQTWNVALQAYENRYHRFNVFNADYLLEEQTRDSWDETTGTFVPDTKTIFIPNVAANNYDGITNQMWDAANQTWLNTDRSLNVYNANFDLVQFNGQTWNTTTNTWDDNYQVDYAVTPEGRVVASLFRPFDADLGIFVNGNRSFENYNGDIHAETVRQIYDAEEFVWDTVSRSLYTYENMLLSGTNNQSFQQGNWINNDSIHQTYTTNGDEAVKTLLGWNGMIYSPYLRTINEYDGDNNLIEFRNEEPNDEGWRYLGHCDFSWSLYEVIDTTTTDTTTNFVYEPVISPCDIPNPYQLGQSFSCDKLTGNTPKTVLLFDLNGKIIATQQLNNQSSVQFRNNIATGIYALVILEKGTIIHRQKLVVIE